MKTYTKDPWFERQQRRDRRRALIFGWVFWLVAGWLIYLAAIEEPDRPLPKCVWVQELNRAECE